MNASPTAHPVRLGLLGLNFGKGIAQILRANVPELAVHALCDLDGPKVEAAAREFGATAYTSLETMLRDPALEAIGLFSGPLGRAQLVRQILRAGKHVLTTKPFELDPAASRAVLAEARESGLVLHLNSPATEPTADLRTICEWIRTHQLGAPIGLAAATWASYRETPSGTWYDDARLCPVAPILRLGIYFLNDFIPLLGTPTHVQVSESRIFTRRPTSDNALLSVRYAQGALASVFASFCIEDGEPYRDEVTLHFERGQPIAGEIGELRIEVDGSPDVRCILDRGEDKLRHGKVVRAGDERGDTGCDLGRVSGIGHNDPITMAQFDQALGK